MAGNATEVATATPKPLVQASRLHKLLSQPQTVREVFLLKELLDKPLALRRR